MRVGDGPLFIKILQGDDPHEIDPPHPDRSRNFDAERVKATLERLRIPDVELKYRGPELSGGGTGSAQEHAGGAAFATRMGCSSKSSTRPMPAAPASTAR